MQAFLSDLDLEGIDAGAVRTLDFDDESQGESSGVKQWRVIHRIGEAKGAVYLVVTPTHAHYDAALGLQLGRQTHSSAFRSKETRTQHDAGFDPYSYTKE